MSDSLALLDKRRGEIQRAIAELGDMRSGSISKTGGGCGNPRCHCHRPGEPGHGPYYRLTKKVNGKTVTETFSSAAGLRKAQREVGEFHRFRTLSQELLAVNEKICQARSVEDTLSPEEKKRPKRSSGKSSKK
jgi:hypothetical protein